MCIRDRSEKRAAGDRHHDRAEQPRALKGREGKALRPVGEREVGAEADEGEGPPVSGGRLLLVAVADRQQHDQRDDAERRVAHHRQQQPERPAPQPVEQRLPAADREAQKQQRKGAHQDFRNGEHHSPADRCEYSIVLDASVEAFQDAGRRFHRVHRPISNAAAPARVGHLICVSGGAVPGSPVVKDDPFP